MYALSQSDDQQDIYERKYYALKRKCEEVQQVGQNLTLNLYYMQTLGTQRPCSSCCRWGDGWCYNFRSGYVHDDVYEFGQFPTYTATNSSKACC